MASIEDAHSAKLVEQIGLLDILGTEDVQSNRVEPKAKLCS